MQDALREIEAIEVAKAQLEIQLAERDARIKELESSLDFAAKLSCALAKALADESYKGEP